MEFFQATNIHLYIAIALALVNAVLLCFLSGKFLQIIQQSGYKSRGYMMWLRGTQYKYYSRLFMLSFLSVACALVTNSLFDVYHSQAIYSYLGLIFYFYFSAVSISNFRKEQSKMPLVKTKRIKRTVVAMFVVYAAITFVLIALSTEYFKLLRFAIITLTPLFVPIMILAVYYMLLPLEIMINKYYIKKAHKKLVTMPNLTKIAITGSYAKTTNKFVLEKMLQKKYNVLISPHSYNTPLGLSKVILSDLNSNHQIFIAEMGAKKVGEIAELCTMIQPNHAILTGIGTQHLETFKTEQNIIDTKNELALYVAQNQGITVYNGQNQKCIDLWQSSQNPNKILAGAENNFAFAKTTFVDKNGLKFELTIDGKTTTCKTSLLGEYNLQNICMCAALAYKLGVKLQQIKQAISELKPAEHRMQIIDSGSNIVIDDSFNASIEGCAVALSTIALFDDKTKVIITPGIVEMGKHETMTNFELGQKIAQHCDIAILVNEVNREAMLDGLRQQNFDETKIFCVDDLEQARAKIVELSLHNSVILFENDLPDIFELN